MYVVHITIHSFEKYSGNEDAFSVHICSLYGCTEVFNLEGYSVITYYVALGLGVGKSKS